MKKKALAILLSVLLIGVLPCAVSAEGEASGDGVTGDDYQTGGHSTVDTPTDDSVSPIRYYKGVVLKVETVTYQQDSTLDYNTVKQTSEVEILTGPYKSRVYTIENSIQLDNPKRIELKADDTVMLSAELTADGSEINNIYIYDYYRVNYVTFAFAAIIVILIAVCLGRGLKTLVNIVAVTLMIYFYYMPLVLKGISPILLMLPICFAFAFINILWDLQLSARGFSALAAALAGVLLSGLFGMLSEKLGHTVGLGESELTMLLYSSEHMSLDFSGLTFALCMLISLGAIINVSVLMSDYMYAYKSSSPYITIKQLFKYGMDIGRDAIERNCLTLFFATAAAMVPSLLVYASFSTPVTELINMDVLASQLFRLLAAMAGMCISMPLNAYLHALTLKGKSLY